MSKWQTLLETHDIILADGAMGSMLIEAGLQSGELPVVWNVERPERVKAVHRDYLRAGSQLLLTNTFSGNRFRLGAHNLEARVEELNRAGAKILREEVDAAGGNAIVAGDIGPSGEMLAPLGKLEFADAVDGFAEQAAALIDGGADVIWIETMADLEEVHAAIMGVRRISREIPIIASMTFDRHGRTMMGVTPEKAVRTLTGWGTAAVGGNCGSGPEELLGVIREMHVAAPDAILVAKSNAGIPTSVDGKTAYPATPEIMASYARDVRDAGARIIGGCCGTTPAHLSAMAQALHMR